MKLVTIAGINYEILQTNKENTKAELRNLNTKDIAWVDVKLTPLD